MTMAEKPRHAALAEDGPVGGWHGLWVEKYDDEPWPDRVWTTGPAPDERHVYRWKTMALTPTGVPLYSYVRTLGADDAG
jgi:hypothetical protein